MSLNDKIIGIATKNAMELIKNQAPIYRMIIAKYGKLKDKNVENLQNILLDISDLIDSKQLPIDKETREILIKGTMINIDNDDEKKEKIKKLFDDIKHAIL